MKHLRLFEDFAEIPASARDFFDLTKKIKLENDFSMEGPAETYEEALKIRNESYPIFRSILPQHSYYYQNSVAVEHCYKIYNQIWEKFGEDLKNIGWWIIPCVLGFPTYTPRWKENEGEQTETFYIWDKAIKMYKEEKTEEELKAIRKQVAKENGVTHIGTVGQRITVDKWDGSLM